MTCWHLGWYIGFRPWVVMQISGSKGVFCFPTEHVINSSGSGVRVAATPRHLEYSSHFVICHPTPFSDVIVLF